MIIEIPDFFDKRLCNYLITYFHETQNKVNWEPGVEIVRLYDHMHSESIKKVHMLLARHGFDAVGRKHYLQNFEIVRRAPGNIMSLHKDFDQHHHTMIIYLNDNFRGGETHIEGINIPAVQGKAVTFPGNQMEHGVNEVHNNARFVMTAWWSPI